MGKTVSSAVVALVAFILMDRYLTYGRYTDAMLVVLNQLRHSFGV
jgi:hypothetical protein